MTRKAAPLGASTTDDLISRLVEDLEPVRPLRLSVGMGLVLGGALVAAGGVCLISGLRPDIALGRIEPHLVLVSGLVLMLGVAAAATVVRMCRPHVGSDFGGTNWAMVMAALLPASALVIGFGKGSIGLSANDLRSGVNCLGSGVLWGGLALAALVWWLRRGAPVRPDRAAILSGVAAGSFGMFAIRSIAPATTSSISVCGTAARSPYPR